jgi:hypothetical protein
MFRNATSLFPDDARLLMDFLFGTKQASSTANRRVRQRKLVALWAECLCTSSRFTPNCILQTVLLTLDTSANNDQHPRETSANMVCICPGHDHETMSASANSIRRSLHSEQQPSRPPGRTQAVCASRHSADKTPTPGRERLHLQVRLPSRRRQAHRWGRRSGWAPYRLRRPHHSSVDRVR